MTWSSPIGMLSYRLAVRRDWLGRGAPTAFIDPYLTPDRSVTAVAGWRHQVVWRQRIHDADLVLVELYGIVFLSLRTAAKLLYVIDIRCRYGHCQLSSRNWIHPNVYNFILPSRGSIKSTSVQSDSAKGRIAEVSWSDFVIAGKIYWCIELLCYIVV